MLSTRAAGAPLGLVGLLLARSWIFSARSGGQSGFVGGTNSWGAGWFWTGRVCCGGRAQTGLGGKSPKVATLLNRNLARSLHYLREEI